MIDRNGERSALNPSGQAGGDVRDLIMDVPWRLADAVRVLAGDPATPTAAAPVGMAEAATVLWTRFLKFDAADPQWPDRDRFVLSDGAHRDGPHRDGPHRDGPGRAGPSLLGALRQLSGHIEHPELLESGDGPLGPGLGVGVGMALAERLMAARFGRSLVDHRTWVVATDGDLMEGLSHELASLAGHLRLEKLTVLWDDNGLCREGPTGLASSDDVLARFTAYGWAVRRVDAGDGAAVAAALTSAVRGRKPTLIACRAPDQDAAPQRPPAAVPVELSHAWRAAGARGAVARRAWLKRAARHPLGAEFSRVTAGQLPPELPALIDQLCRGFVAAGVAVAPRVASQRVLETLVSAMPELVGGSTDLTALTMTQVKGMASAHAELFAGRYIQYGIREHGMAAAMNGMALHGGVIPYGGTFLLFTDHMRPALRQAATVGRRVIHVLMHGADDMAPDASPIEQLAALRAMPNVAIFHPACAVEVAECWALALSRHDGPSLLVLGCETAPVPHRAPIDGNRCADGGYVVAEPQGERQATLIATGAELAVASKAARLLGEGGIEVAVVSLPCWELFAATSVSYRAQVLGTAPRIGVEAGCGFGWERWLGDDGVFLGSGRDVTADTLAAAVRRRLSV